MSVEAKGTAWPWQGLLALAAVAVLTYHYLSPLNTSRPVERTGVSLKLERQQNVNSRLWQDPLVAAYARDGQLRALSQEAKNNEYEKEMSRHTLCQLRKQIQDCRGDHGKNGLQVLAAIVPGGAYAEYGETRLRHRRAVLEALGMRGFAPTDGEYLDYVEVQWPKAEETYDTLLIPFEWCEPMLGTAEGASPDSFRGKILVLWLRDEPFESKLLSSLVKLNEKLGIDPKKTPVKVLGPRNSEGLRGLVDEIIHHDDTINKSDAVTKENLKGISIFSATATASESLLLYGKLKDAHCSSVKELLDKNLNEPDFHFYRTTCTDEDVCKELVLELGRRGVHLSTTSCQSTTDHVALIAEWDTFYGRALPLTFASVLSGDPPRDNIQGLPENIHAFRYLRGIDGMLPDIAIKEAPSKNDSKEFKNPLLPRETTEGLNQADYLRRLAVHLRDLNERLLRDNGEGLKAVGVLGSDVYDKLLILKALRPTLPGVLFFTNSLDARLGHPDEWQSARNLIVASPFGLEVTKKWDDEPLDMNPLGQILPFRDSYQTAIYAATLLAFSDNMKLGTRTIDKLVKPPRLYEIGRNGPYELPRKADRNNHPGRIHALQSFYWWNEGRILGALAIGVLVVLMTAWVRFVLMGTPKESFSEGTRKGKKVGKSPERKALEEMLLPAKKSRLRRISTWMVFPLACLFSWFLVSFCLVPAQIDFGEPFEWLEGISIWPTEVIRILAIILALFYFWNTHQVLEDNKKDIEAEFGLAEPEKKEIRPKRLRLRAFSRDWFAQHVRRLTLTHWEVYNETTRKIGAQDLWNEYIWSGMPHRRIARILPLFLCYMLAASLIMFLLGFPSVPYRGEFSMHADKIVITLLVLVATALTFYVADATILNRRLINYLAIEGDTEWPVEAYDNYRKKLRLPSKPLDPTAPYLPAVVHMTAIDPKKPQAELLCDYLEIELIARRTQVVSGLIYYPFIVASLTIVSRLGVFDNWGWPLSLILVLLLNASYAGWSAFRLRNSAERARGRTLQRLREILVAYTANGEPDCPDTKLIHMISSEIENEKRGAFAAISHHPIFGAILLPSGGVGLWALTQYLPKLFQ